MVYFDNAQYVFSNRGVPGMFLPSVQGCVYMGESIDMEYIGDDMNGNPIYEGDEIMALFKWDEEKEYRTIRGHVTYSQSNQAYMIKHKGVHNPLMCFLKDIQLTGKNIHQNPELLNP